MAAGVVGINVKGFGEHFHRRSLESAGTVVQGHVVDRLLAHCAGIRCSQRTHFTGEIGSKGYRAFMDGCGSARRYRCHTDVVVRYEHDGLTRQLVGQVSRRDFERLAEGSRVAVLVDVDDPSGSKLRDYDPEGFLFYVAIFVDVVGALLAAVLLSPNRRSRRRPPYARQ